jgi:mono/diheme cytochrome c family protein
MPHCMPKSNVRRLQMMAGAICAALAIASSPAMATTPEGGTLTGPATPEELSVAKGDFVTYCSACHGTDAKGTGPVAMELKTRPADLTRIAQRNGGTFDREAVYKTIEGLDMPASHGSAEMPVWGAWFVHQAVGEGVLLDDARTAARQATNRINNLVKYLETLQK